MRAINSSIKGSPMSIILSVMRNWKNFSGRSGRGEYWWFTLWSTLVAGALTACDFYLFGDAAGYGGYSFALGSGAVATVHPVNLTNLFGIVTLIPITALSVRRLHDVNRSGFWLLIVLTFFGLFVVAYWAVKPGDSESNAYGVSPALTP